MNDQYVKVVYRSEPIRKDKIVLELTTFDYEKYERDKELKEGKQLLAIGIEKKDIEDDTISRYKLYQIQEYIDKFYSKKYDELMKIIKTQQQELIWYKQRVASPVLTFREFNDEEVRDLFERGKEER